HDNTVALRPSPYFNGRSGRVVSGDAGSSGCRRAEGSPVQLADGPPDRGELAIEAILIRISGNVAKTSRRSRRGLDRNRRAAPNPDLAARLVTGGKRHRNGQISILWRSGHAKHVGQGPLAALRLAHVPGRDRGTFVGGVAAGQGALGREH